MAYALINNWDFPAIVRACCLRYLLISIWQQNNQKSFSFSRENAHALQTIKFPEYIFAYINSTSTGHHGRIFHSSSDDHNGIMETPFSFLNKLCHQYIHNIISQTKVTSNPSTSIIILETTPHLISTATKNYCSSLARGTPAKNVKPLITDLFFLKNFTCAKNLISTIKNTTY